MSRLSRSGSVGSSVVAASDDGNDSSRETRPLLDVDDDDHLASSPRRGSLMAAIGDMGGVNSIRSFTRSWQRAAGFPEVVPNRPSLVLVPDDPEHEQGPPHPDQDDAGSDLESAWHRRGRRPGLSPSSSSSSSSPETAHVGGGASLLRQHFEEARRRQSDDGSAHHHAPPLADPQEREHKSLDAQPDGGAHSSSPARSSILPVHPPPPPLVGSFGSYRSYGTIQAAGGSLHRPDMVWEPVRGDDGRDNDLPPILVQEVEQDGKLVLAIKGQSTLPQTVFNSTNALIGVGILSLPLAFKYSGWIPGLVMLTVCALTTGHTSRLMARCMELDATVVTFADLAFKCYGPRIQAVVAIMFTAELVAANVALVVLFADSMSMLFPDTLGLDMWKAVFCVLLLPLNMLPLRILSFTSVAGIMSTFFIVATVMADGCIKREPPGSLLSPAPTFLMPENWMTLPLAYGLFLSPFAAHSVLPNIYRDMRHPHKFTRAINITFSFTYMVDLAMAVVGILMFGDKVREEITSNIIENPAYPKVLTYIMSALIAIIPLSKVPLNTRPLVTSAELLCGAPSHHHVHHHHHHHHHSYHNAEPTASASLWALVLRVCIRVFIALVYLVISILFPSFDSILSLMGSLLCATISVILPILFYLKLFGKDVSPRETLVLHLVVVVFGVGSVVGTVFNIVPKHVLGVH